MKLLQLLIGILSAATLAAQDVVIYGGTPGGIAAAIAAARQGRSVALITPPHSPTPVPVLTVSDAPGAKAISLQLSPSSPPINSS